MFGPRHDRLMIAYERFVVAKVFFGWCKCVQFVALFGDPLARVYYIVTVRWRAVTRYIG